MSAEWFSHHNKTITNAFAAQVERHHARLAVVASDGALTYQELDAKSEWVASALITSGVTAHQVAALMCDRSTRTIVGMLGILKSAAAYLPLDPKDPPDRVNEIVARNSAAAIVGTRAALSRHGKLAGLPTVILDDELDGRDAVQSPQSRVACLVDPCDIAYVIHTSGSTGTPKGVLINHHNVMLLVQSLHQTVLAAHGPALRIGLVAPFVFDASVQQIFSALLLGHTLCIADDGARFDGRALRAFLDRQAVDVCDGTPAHLKILAASGRRNDPPLSVHHFLIGGDVLTPAVIEDFVAACGDHAAISNLYGVAEACVDSLLYRVDRQQIQCLGFVPIGSPLPHVAAYVVDSSLRPVPPGHAGELCIGGPGVGAGYVARDDLASQRFLPDPFRAGGRLYRTGDVVRLLPTGDFQFLGRNDRQVKIRGYRVEPGEVEQVLLRCKQTQARVVDAVVMLRTKRDAPYLCAYYVTEGELDPGFLDSYLRQWLPNFSLPAYYVSVPEVPLTNSGKIDYSKLPEPSPNWRTVSIEEPVSDTERRLLKIWQDVLGADHICVSDDFFTLGGDSLAATVLAGLVEEAFGVELPVAGMLQGPTVRQAARLVDSRIDYHVLVDEGRRADGPRARR